METGVVIVYLTRIRIPAFAPQTVQVLSTAHALAVAGADVYVFADLPWGYTPEGGTPNPGKKTFPARFPVVSGPSSPDDLQAVAHTVLADYGLAPHPRLHLSWLPSAHPLQAGMAFRRRVLAKLLEARRRHALTILLSRRVDYAADFLRVRTWLRRDVRLVHAWHYVDSANALEAGRRDQARRMARLEQRILQGADGHIAISSRLESYLARRPPRGPLRVVPNGGPEPLRPPGYPPAPGKGLRWPARRGRVVYAGLFRRVQDLRPVLDAVRRLPPDVDVVVVGGDDSGQRLRAVMDLADSEGIPWTLCPGGFPTAHPQARRTGGAGARHASLCFAGPMTVRESRRLVAQADVAVAAFQDTVNMRWFACPLKILEYHAAGVPVVATDHPTVREVVEQDKTGLLVPPGDGGALSRAILHLLSAPDEANRMAEAGLARAARSTWARRGQELLAWFQHIGTLPSHDGQAGMGVRTTMS